MPLLFLHPTAPHCASPRSRPRIPTVLLASLFTPEYNCNLGSQFSIAGSAETHASLRIAAIRDRISHWSKHWQHHY